MVRRGMRSSCTLVLMFGSLFTKEEPDRQSGDYGGSRDTNTKSDLHDLTVVRCLSIRFFRVVRRGAWIGGCCRGSIDDCKDVVSAEEVASAKETVDEGTSFSMLPFESRKTPR